MTEAPQTLDLFGAAAPVRAVGVLRRVIQTPGKTADEIGRSYRERVDKALAEAIAECVAMRDAEHQGVDDRFAVTTAVRGTLERLLDEVGGEHIGIAQMLVGEAAHAHGSV